MLTRCKLLTRARAAEREVNVASDTPRRVCVACGHDEAVHSRVTDRCRSCQCEAFGARSGASVDDYQRVATFTDPVSELRLHPYDRYRGEAIEPDDRLRPPSVPRVRLRRGDLTPDELERVRARDRERWHAWREQLSPDELADYRAREHERYRRRRDKSTRRA